MSERTFKSHPRSILSESAKSLAAFIGVSLLPGKDLLALAKDVLIDGKELDWQEVSVSVLVFVGIMLILFLLTLGSNWRVWKKRSFALDQESFHVRDERLNRRRLSFYLKDLSNITVSQNLGERLLGLSRLTLNTNTKDTATADDVWIILPTADTEALADTLRAGRSRPAPKAPERQEEQASPEAGEVPWRESDRKSLLRHLIFETRWLTLLISGLLFSWSLIAVIGLWVFDQRLPLVPLSEDELHLGFMALLPVFSFLAPIASSYFRTYLRIYGFRLRRVGAELEIESGLLTRKKSRIPIRRIHALVLEQGVIARIGGYGHMTLVNIGAEGEEEAPQFLLTASLSVLQRQTAELLPEFEWPEGAMRQPKRALLPLWSKRLPISIALLAVAHSLLSGYWHFLMLPLWLLLPLYLYLSWRTPALTLGADRLVLTDGIFDVREVQMRFKDVEQLTFHQHLAARPVQVGYGTFHYLSKGFTGFESTGYFHAGLFDEIEDRIVATAEL